MNGRWIVKKRQKDIMARSEVKHAFSMSIISTSTSISPVKESQWLVDHVHFSQHHHSWYPSPSWCSYPSLEVTDHLVSVLPENGCNKGFQFNSSNLLVFHLPLLCILYRYEMCNKKLEEKCFWKINWISKVTKHSKVTHFCVVYASTHILTYPILGTT